MHRPASGNANCVVVTLRGVVLAKVMQKRIKQKACKAHCWLWAKKSINQRALQDVGRDALRNENASSPASLLGAAAEALELNTLVVKLLEKCDPINDRRE